MQTFDPGVNHKAKSIPFVIAYIDNEFLSNQERIFTQNDFDFHNSLSHYAHSIDTLYSGTVEQAIKEAQELGKQKILCVTEGLTYLDKFIQEIIHNDYTQLDNWKYGFLNWINLESSNTTEAPDAIINALKLTEQFGEYSILDNYYKLMTQSTKWYVTNTEDTLVTEPEEHTNEIIVTAGALTPALEAMTYFTKPGYINIVDNSSIAHQMWQHIIENWNGKNYIDFIKDIYKKYPSLSVDFTSFSERQLVRYNDFINADWFIDRWDIVKQSKIRHHYRDFLVNDPCDIISTSLAPSTYVNFSNAYHFYPTAVYFTPEHRYKKWLKVYETVRDKNHQNFKVTFNERGMHGILRYRGRRP